MAPEVVLAAALAALQALVIGVLGWLVQRIGRLTEKQEAVAVKLSGMTEWRTGHTEQDDDRHSDMRAEIRAQRAEYLTRFETVEKLSERVMMLEMRARAHGDN